MTINDLLTLFGDSFFEIGFTALIWCAGLYMTLWILFHLAKSIVNTFVGIIKWVANGFDINIHIDWKHVWAMVKEILVGFLGAVAYVLLFAGFVIFIGYIVSSIFNLK